MDLPTAIGGPTPKSRFQREIRSRVGESGVWRGGGSWTRLRRPAARTFKTERDRGGEIGVGRAWRRSVSVPYPAPFPVNTTIAPSRSAAPGRAETLADRAVALARAYLEEHWDRNVSLDELARAAGLSKFHLTRRFARSVGVPPHAYQNQLRVHHAADMLRRGLPVGEAARRAGFCDASHLSRHFKRALGTTPGRYLRDHAHAGAARSRPPAYPFAPAHP